MKLYLPPPSLSLSFNLAILLSTTFLSSCKTTEKQDGAQYATNGQYATYPSDGHYNPYPAGSKPLATSSTQSQYQQYNEAPPPPSQPKKSSTSASSTSTKKKKPSTSNSSTSKTASTTKKKPSGSTTSKTASSASGTTYVVKQSDTLYGISRKFHVTVSKLKSTNNLTSDVIRSGMKLKIP